jgi:diphthine synthase
MLYLIGLGLDKKDISLKGLEIVKKCDYVYLEIYTNVYYYSQKEIEKVIGKKTIRADRKMIEEGKEIIDNARKKSVAVLVSGDPLSATTHIDLMLRAKKEKIKVNVIHAPSIFTAVAETGLQLYKFGKTASIARWQPNFHPESFYDIIKENLNVHAHTLVLIDIGLPVKEALGYVDSIAKMRDPEMLERKILVCELLGTDKQKITYGKLNELMKKKYFSPACIIIPGGLHFMEIEALSRFSS